MMQSTLTDSFSVADDLTVAQAVARTLKHFSSAPKSLVSTAPLLPSLSLRYRGREIPVSVDDTAATLTARVCVYVDCDNKIAAAA